MATTYHLVESQALDRIGRELAPRVALYAAAVDAALDRYTFLPFAAAQHRLAGELLQQPTAAGRVDQVNRYLQSVAAEAGIYSVYLLDPQGLTLASSNWQDQHSYVGQNYGFRPYFRDALAGGVGHFYGIGLSTRQAGYFIAAPVRVNRDFDRGTGGRIAGVMAAKVNLDTIEAVWREAEAPIFANDANGVIILSSQPEWRYRSVRPLGAAAQAQIRQQRQFLEEPLPPLDWQGGTPLAAGGRLVSLPMPVSRGKTRQREYLAHSHTVRQTGWQLTAFADVTPARQAARSAAIGVAFAYASLALALLYLRQRWRRIRERNAAAATLQKAHAELERKVDERTANLTMTNVLLQREIDERQRTELALRSAQEELLQRTRLEALGRMAAALAHELNQPLAALRTLSDNAQVLLQRARYDDAGGNLANIAQMVDRMRGITVQLKGFARKSTHAPGCVSLAAAIEQALFTLALRIEAEQVEIVYAAPDPALQVRCSPVGLEQVLVNLLSNAMDAMRDQARRQIEISCRQEAERLLVSIRDCGSGLSHDAVEHLFDPFFTTKPPGEGLGLGLALSFGTLQAAGGQLHGRNRPEGGAEFTMALPLLRTELPSASPSTETLDVRSAARR